MDYNRPKTMAEPFGECQGGRLAGPGAGTGELAFGRIAAFVDAFQALGDDGLQLPDLVLFVGFFGIHRGGAMTWAATVRTMPTS